MAAVLIVIIIILLCTNIFLIFSTLYDAEKYSELYAFHYKPKEGEMVKQSSGWALFDSQNEYSRMGVPNELWRSTSLNSEYEVNLYLIAWT